MQGSRFALITLVGVLSHAACGGLTESPSDAMPVGAPGAGPGATVHVQLMEDVLFYDASSYPPEESLPRPLLPANVVRLDNSVVAMRLDDDLRSQIRPHVALDVSVGAACDTGIRVGSVRLAFVDKGAESYAIPGVPHLELGRFMTPAMNKNVEPTSVPYTFEVDHLAPILGSSTLASAYDFWLEFSIVGYANALDVEGCDGRTDTFSGSVTLRSDGSAPARELDTILEGAFQFAFNNYASGTSDQVGSSKKTVTVWPQSPLEDAEAFVIISPHDISADGEQFKRRDYFVSLDGELALEFTPGRASCEPFRQYNTEPNGFYQSEPRSDLAWQETSSWCPGDIIDLERIPWGPLSAGEHSIAVEVPDAEFVGGSGELLLSVMVLGKSASD